MKKTMINYFGLLGLVSLISYTAAVLFAPVNYPGYDWLSQAVSDLSAANAPSRQLWGQLAALHGTCGVVSVTCACIYFRDKLSRLFRTGIYLFAVMLWISDVGYRMFPLSESGYAGTFQDVMHVYVISAAVVILSSVSLILIAVGGLRNKKYRLLGILAAVSFIVMLVGGIGTGAAPKSLFGLFERFSVFAPTVFNAILGIYLFKGSDE